jgi:hypothetical protein
MLHVYAGVIRACTIPDLNLRPLVPNQVLGISGFQGERERGKFSLSTAINS